jgi:hypothetical protein
MFQYRPNEIGMQGLLGLQNQAFDRVDRYDNMQLQRDMQSNDLGLKYASMEDERVKFNEQMRQSGMLGWANVRLNVRDQDLREGQSIRSDGTIQRGQDKAFEASKYSADRGFDSTKYSSDTQQSIANQLHSRWEQQFSLDNDRWGKYTEPYLQDSFRRFTEQNQREMLERGYALHNFDRPQLQPVMAPTVFESAINSPLSPLYPFRNFFSTGSKQRGAQEANTKVVKEDVAAMEKIARDYIESGGDPSQVPKLLQNALQYKDGTGGRRIYGGDGSRDLNSRISNLQNSILGTTNAQGSVGMLQLMNWPKNSDSRNGQVSPTGMPFNHQANNPNSGWLQYNYPRYTGNATGQ